MHECERRDIVLRTRDDRLQRILETHRAYDALQYPLIYCHGEDGYNFGLYQVNPTTRVTNYQKKNICSTILFLPFTNKAKQFRIFATISWFVQPIYCGHVRKNRN